MRSFKHPGLRAKPDGSFALNHAFTRYSRLPPKRHSTPACHRRGTPLTEGTAMTATTASNYVFDDAWLAERSRLGSLEAALDPGTIRHLIALGTGPGWNCLEAGAGAGSIASWLCERVGARGHVVASDLQTAFLHNLNHPNLEVWRHDIVTQALPANRFDLIHVRWTLHWPPGRQTAAASMASALRPGGWLLAEEPDFVTFYHGPGPEVVTRVATKAVRLLETLSGGMDSQYGRRLPADLLSHGLADVQAEGRVHQIHGGSPGSGSAWLRLTVEKVAHRLLASDAVTQAELDQTFRLLEDPAFATYSPMTVACRGRRAG
jgi:SAM-dependent methyltransferase